jgi:apolipoprotein N-acyltransferase
VLGVEKIPFSGWIPALNDLALSLGGSSQTLGASKEPDVVESRFTKAKISTAICYESIYGFHMAQAAYKGANLFFIMTNDGWWRNTPGYKQHLSYARLRAIELRRSIARSANTGISAFIDQRGQLIKSTRWWESTAIRHSLNLNNRLTIYAQTGDVLYSFGLYISLGILLVWLYCAIRGITAGRTKEI